MNREEVDHGCSQEESEEIEIEKEGQEGRAEEKESSAPLRPEAQVRSKEESGAEEKSRAEKSGTEEEESTS